MDAEPEVLGAALVEEDALESGCRLVFTEALLHEPSPKVFVIFTDFDSTVAALKSAAAWADHLSFGIHLVVPQVVPYPLSAARPIVPVAFTLDQVRRAAARSGVDADARVYFCRDRLQVLTEVLPHHSLVVIGAGRVWPLSPAHRLARRLRKAGHVVMVAAR